MAATGLTIATALAQSGGAVAKDYFLASGRWDNVVLVIDLEKAIDPVNDATPNAIVNRLRVTPDVEVDSKAVPASGQPIVVTIAPDGRRAYVTNHSGRTPPAEAQKFQHGHAGLVAVLDLAKAIDPSMNGTLGTVERFIESDGFGATGFAILPDGRHAALAHAEREGDEDGGRHVNIVDLAAGKVVHRVEQALGRPGFPCPPTPFPHAAPHPNFGCYPDTNGVTASPLGGGLIFTANGGTGDVSVISIPKAIQGEAGAEIGRIPMQAGGFGISTSPDGRLVAHASRENPQTGWEGNTISLIDVEKAARDPETAEVARIRVGADDDGESSRPFVAEFTPDGRRLVTTQFRTNTVDIVDVSKALSNEPSTVTRITLETPNGEPSRPRGAAITADGRFAAITGAPKGGSNSSMVWVVDLETYEVKGRVTEIGNESYMIGAFRR